MGYTTGLFVGTLILTGVTLAVLLIDIFSDKLEDFFHNFFGH